jgi:hypothetical protein
MKNISTLAALLLGASLVTVLSPVQAGEPVPLTQVHAHNDYNHARPLLDALDNGFCSVEADIFVVDGRLLVAHNRSDTRADRTLQTLYLDPLHERVKTNGGRVFAGGPEFTLLIDFKDDWKSTYPVLKKVLDGYSDMLVTFEGDKKTANAVRVIVTGNRSPRMLAGERVRCVSLDGELPNLNPADPAALYPWISGNWKDSFTWRGKGAMPAAEQAKLKDIVARAHAQGKRVRFWNAPDNTVFWTEIRADGVDLINTDHLPEARQFLLKQP